MATGKTHDKITILCTPIALIIVFAFNNLFLSSRREIAFYCFIFVLSYFFGGYMFSGDLDIKSREYNRWKTLKFIWIPYQKVFKHRSIFTHGFILGPLIRVLYLLVIFILALLFLSIALSHPIDISLVCTDILNLIYEEYILFINLFLGIFMGSSIHTIADIVSSYLKKI